MTRHLYAGLVSASAAAPLLAGLPGGRVTPVASALTAAGAAASEEACACGVRREARA